MWRCGSPDALAWWSNAAATAPTDRRHAARRLCPLHSEEPALEIIQYPGHRGPVGGDDVLAAGRRQRRQQGHRLGRGEREVPSGPPS